MKKAFTGIDQLAPGMKIAETIHNEYGALIIREGTILDEHLLNKLKNLGFSRIRIYLQDDNIIFASGAELFKAQYKENIEDMKEILHNLSSGRSMDIAKINKATGFVMGKINENRDVINCLNKVRNTDEYTYTHSLNVSFLCLLIGKWMRLSIGNIRLLVEAGLLHDIGKAMIPGDILNKPDKLTEAEFDEIKKHPVYGLKILEKRSIHDGKILNAVLMHHERNDGLGYPLGIKEKEIDYYAKIIAVADIFDAMTSKRVYKDKESPFKVFELLEKSAFGVLDTKIVSAFLSNIAAYYIGDRIKLNTGDIGEIVYINPRSIPHPLVKVRDRYVDLSTEKSLSIVEIV